MLQVDIEKIIPVTEARDMFNKIVDEVEGTDEMYVLTKNGKPSAVVVGVNHLEKLTGAEGSEVMAKIVNMNNDAATVPVPAANIVSDAVPAAAAPADPFSAPAESVIEPISTPAAAIPVVEPEPIAQPEVPAPFGTPAPENTGGLASDDSASIMPNLPPVDTTPAAATGDIPQTPQNPANPAGSQPIQPNQPQSM